MSMIRTLSTARWAIVGLVLAMLIIPAAFTLISGLRIVEVDGRSMTPTYQLGDIVLIGQPTPADLHVGHIVTVKSADGSMYTHRIIGIRDGQLQLKGDGNKIADPTTISPRNVVGAVRGHLQQPAAHLVELIETLPMRISLAAIAIALTFLPLRKDALRNRDDSQGRDNQGRSSISATRDFHNLILEPDGWSEPDEESTTIPMRGN